MSATLEGDRAAALADLAAAAAEAPAGGRQRHRLRSVDFTRPTKFTSDHQRRITRAIDTFCQTATTRLSAELRCTVELVTTNTDQVTWSAAQTGLSSGTACMILELDPLGTSIQLSADLPFLLTGIEILLGALPDQPPPERRLSEIDWVLTRRLFETLVTQLAVPWHELTGSTLTPGPVEFASDGGGGPAMSEPTFVVELEARINRVPCMLSLLIPWMAIEAVADRMAGRVGNAADGDSPELSALERRLSAVPVLVRAEVGAARLAVAEILALRPGDLLHFAAPAEAGMTVFAENVRLGRAQPGASGPRRAFLLTEREESEAPDAG